MKEKEDKNGISDKKLRELKDQALDVLSATRQKIIMFYPFIGAISMRLDLVPVRDYRIRTACTDGHTVYFDIDFLSKLDNDERVFVLSHEIWHVVLMHMLRRQNRNCELFNIATDCEVNYLLKQDGQKSPPNLVFPEKEWEGKSAEEIYEILLKKLKRDVKKNGGRDKNDGEKNEKSNGDGSSSGNKNDDSSDKRLSGQFDKHEYGDEENNKDGNEKDGTGVKDQWGDVGEDPDYNPTIDSDLAEDIRESIVSAAQQMERQRGNLPEHIKQILDKIEKPEIPWQEVLAQFVTTTFDNGERTWLPPNRRYVWQDVYIPSVYGKKVNVTVAVDTSGSTTADLPKFFAELKSLMDSFGNYNCRVITCDAEVNDVYEYNSEENPFDPDIRKFNFGGGGGTCLSPVFDYIEDSGIESDCLIFLTDGFCEQLTKAPPYPVLWVITNEGSDSSLGFGKKIWLKGNNKECN